MSITKSGLIVQFVLLAAGIAACGGGGSGSAPPAPPAISNLTLGQAAVTQSSTAASIPGSLHFTDPTGHLSSITVAVLDAGGHTVSQSTSPLSGANGMMSGTLDAMVQFVPSVPAVYTIHVYVADADGVKSNTLSTQFQVIAAASLAAVVATTGPSPSSLTLSNGTLYWLESGEDALSSVAVDGGSPQVLATRMVSPISLAFAGSDVIWSDFRGTGSCPAASPDQVLKRTSASGVTSVVASGGACGMWGGAGIAVIGPTLYWTSGDPSQATLHATPLGGGTTTTVATSTLGIQQVVASGNALYWLESSPTLNSTSAIRSVPAGGGPITTVLGGFNSGVPTFAVDATNVYYTVPTGANAVGSVDLMAAPLAGGAATPLVTGISLPPFKLISTGTRVVWINRFQEVWSVPVAGGSAISLYTGASGGGPYDVAFDGSQIVWTDANGIGTPTQLGAVRAVPEGGGPVSILYQSSDLPQQLAVDSAGRINWIESDGRGLARIARIGAGNVPETVADGISSNPPTLVVAGNALILPDLRRLKRIPLDGSLPFTLFADTLPIGNLATDGTSLVWNDARTGTLRKAPVGGGAITVLADVPALGAYVGTPGPIRLGPNGSAYWIVSVAPGPGQPGTPYVVSAPVATPSTSVAALASSLPNAVDLAVDATGVYVAEFAGVGPSIIRSSLGGAGALTTVFADPVGPRLLALDGSTVYWMDGFGISKIPTAGGAPLGVVAFDGNAVGNSFVVDAASAYFTSPSRQDIRRTPK